jgi:acyl carrier protein
MKLRADLLKLLRETLADDRLDVADDQSLIHSGLLDSTALFELVFWVERQTGSPIDPSSFDLAEQWDTVAGILGFVEARRSRA